MANDLTAQPYFGPETGQTKDPDTDPFKKGVVVAPGTDASSLPPNQGEMTATGSDSTSLPPTTNTTSAASTSPQAATKTNNPPQSVGTQATSPVGSGPNPTPSIQSAPAPTARSTAPNRSQEGTGYTNIQKIMSANSNNQLGNVIGGGITNQAAATRNALQQGQQQFNTDAQSGIVGSDADLARRNSLLQSANTTGLSDQDVTDFQKYLNGTYTGPQALGNLDSLKSQALNTQQLGEATGSAAGRQGLLQRFVGGPTYTSGQQSLDSLLLGQSGGDQLSQARRNALGLLSQVNQADTGAQTYAKQLANQSQGFGQATQNALAQSAGDIYNPIVAQQTADLATRDRLNKEMTSGNISPDDAKLLNLGFGATGTLNTYGVNAGNYINQTAPTLTQETTQAQLAKLQALGKLAGDKYSGLNVPDATSTVAAPSNVGTLQSILGGYTDTSKLGNKNPLFNNTGFQNALNAGQQNYQSDVNKETQAALAYREGILNEPHVIHPEDMDYINQLGGDIDKNISMLKNQVAKDPGGEAQSLLDKYNAIKGQYGSQLKSGTGIIKGPDIGGTTDEGDVEHN